MEGFKKLLANLPAEMVDPASVVTDAVVNIVEGKEQHFRVQTGNLSKGGNSSRRN